MKDFEVMGLRELKGRSNYTCTQHTDNEGNAVDCEIGGMMTKKKEKGDDEGEDGKCGYCPYKAAKEAFVKSALSVTNFPYYLAETIHAGQLANRGMLVCDEGHNLENQILSLAEFTIDWRMCESVGIEFTTIPVVEPGATKKGWEWVKEDFMLAAAATIQKLENELEKLDNKDSKVAKKLNSLKRFMGKVNLFITAENLADWLCYTDTTKGSQTFGCMLIKPLTAQLFADDYLFSKADKIVIMSATILNFEFFMRNLGIDPEDAICVSLDCDFPVETRQVYMAEIGNMSYKTKQASMPLIAAYVGKLMTKFGTKKGIVHTHSYEN